jgi:hypothetical protein
MTVKVNTLRELQSMSGGSWPRGCGVFWTNHSREDYESEGQRAVGATVRGRGGIAPASWADVDAINS